MLYNVVYLFYMFEAVTDSKIRKELYVRVFFRVFLHVFLYFSMVLEICMIAHMYITT